jgi:hypothetical protein
VTAFHRSSLLSVSISYTPYLSTIFSFQRAIFYKTRNLVFVLLILLTIIESSYMIENHSNEITSNI